MADDYQDIGTGIEIFPYTPNWMTKPKPLMMWLLKSRKESWSSNQFVPGRFVK